MPVVKVSEATGSVLDWMVGEAEFRRFQAQGSSVKAWVLEEHKKGLRTDPYSTDWLRAGDIIDSNLIQLSVDRTVGETEGGKEVDEVSGWRASIAPKRYWMTPFVFTGPTSLIAAMRCYVTSKLGHEVEVPDGLT